MSEICASCADNAKRSKTLSCTPEPCTQLLFSVLLADMCISMKQEELSERHTSRVFWGWFKTGHRLEPFFQLLEDLIMPILVTKTGRANFHISYFGGDMTPVSHSDFFFHAGCFMK